MGQPVSSVKQAAQHLRTSMQWELLFLHFAGCFLAVIPIGSSQAALTAVATGLRVVGLATSWRNLSFPGATCASAIAWSCRTLCYISYALCLANSKDVSNTSISLGGSIVAEVLVNCGEQLEAMLVVPAPLVMLLAAQHLFFVISTLLKASAPPSLAVCTIWAVLQLGLPHVLVYRKRKWLTAASEAQCSCSSAQLEVETLHQPAAAASIHQSFATEAGHNSDRQAAVEVQLCLSQTPTALHGPPEHLHSGDVGPSGVSMLSSDRVARACTGNVQPTFTTSAEHQNNSTLQARAYATSCSPNQHHQRLAQYEEEFACDLEGEYVVQYDGDTYYPHYAGQPTATIEGHDQFSSSPLLAASDGSVTVSRAQRTEPAPCLTPALSAGAPSPVMSEGCLPAKRHHQQVQLDVVAPMPHPNQATPVMDTKTAAVGQPACWEPAPAWEPALADPAAAFLGGFDIEPTRVSAGRGSHRPSSRHYMSLEWLDTDPDEELAGSCSLQTSQVQLPPGLQLEQVPEHLCPRFLDDPKQQMDVKKGAEPAPKQLKFRSIQVPRQSIVSTRPASTVRSLQALRTAQASVGHATAAASYRSRLHHPQMVIKVEQTEPEELMPNMLSAATRNLQNVNGPMVSHACVRKGCCLVIFDLLLKPLPTVSNKRIAELEGFPATEQLVQFLLDTPLLDASSRMSSSTCLPLSAPLGLALPVRADGCKEDVDDGSDSSSIPVTSSNKLTPVKAEEGSSTLSSEDVVQALLRSLLAPGTPLPDGAVAHISVGNLQLEARWQQATGSWAVVSTCRSGSDLRLGLLFIDCPVVRLLQAQAATGLSVHCVSLLVQLNQVLDNCSGCPSVIGSAGHEAAPGGVSHDKTGRVLQLQCVARGCWGTCFPVTAAVVDWEVPAAGEHVAARADLAPNREAAGPPAPCTSLLALRLDVDLSTAPSAGVVQLELWQGHTLLVSVPLLLLPGGSDPAAPDPLLQELQQHLTSQDEAHNEGSSGMSAMLSDLGALVFTAQCITKASTAGPGACDCQAEGPGSWGGVVSSTASRHANDTELLNSMLAIAEDLQQYALAVQLPHTTEFITSAAAVVQRRLEVIQVL